MKPILSHIFKEKVDGRSIAIGGLAPHEEDARDFRFTDLGGWFDYKPKHEELVLPMFDVKNQGSNNTCVFHSLASAKEFDEGISLSPRSAVLYAKANRLLRADGLSSLREGQKVGKDFGVASEKLVPNEVVSWPDYVGIKLTDIIRADAALHKSRDYFIVRGKDEWLKALDEGHRIHTGSDWYSSYNMSGGLKAPWILPWRKGWKVGGHAYTCRGYRFKGDDVLRFRNSFGPKWGDNGDFYVRMSSFFKENVVGYVALALEGDELERFIKAHEGRNVKSTKRPAIYRVQGGKRRPFLDPLTFYAHGGEFPALDSDSPSSFDDVADRLLDLMPEGEPMRPEESQYWPVLSADWDTLRWSEQNYALYRIREIIKT